MLSAIRWEERDLITVFGEKYARYRQSVPMLLPIGSSRPGKSTGVHQATAEKSA
jgi:hypothetical protein